MNLRSSFVSGLAALAAAGAIAGATIADRAHTPPAARAATHKAADAATARGTPTPTPGPGVTDAPTPNLVTISDDGYPETTVTCPGGWEAQIVTYTPRPGTWRCISAGP